MVGLNHLRFIAPRSFKHLTVQIEALVRGRLWVKVIAGLILGLVVGVLIGPSVGWITPSIGQLLSRWFALPGELFLAVIQMMVIPLVLSSIIRGSLQRRTSSSFGASGLVSPSTSWRRRPSPSRSVSP